MKNSRNPVVFVSLLLNGILSLDASAQIDEGAATQLAYKGGRLSAAEVRMIQEATFTSPINHDIVLIQALASSERPADLEAAANLAITRLGGALDEWQRELISLQLVGVYGLKGQRRESAQKAEELLKVADFRALGRATNPIVDTLKKSGRPADADFPESLRDGLRQQIGLYYVNRPASEGGPDFQKARDEFNLIVSPGIREFCKEQLLRSDSGAASMKDDFGATGPHTEGKIEGAGNAPDPNESRAAPVVDRTGLGEKGWWGAGIVVALVAAGLIVLRRRKSGRLGSIGD